MVPTAAMAVTPDKQCTVRSQNFSEKGRAAKGFVVCWMLLNPISLGVKQANDALDSLNDHLKIEGESCPYEV